MTQEEKQLLLKVLCEMLPYGVICTFLDKMPEWFVSKFGGDENFKTDFTLSYVNFYSAVKEISMVRPYLRPMSSMTEEEKKEYKSFIFTQHHEWDGHGTSTEYVEIDDAERYVTWLNKKGFDYRGLIPMGLALEAPEGMYKF